MKPARGVVLCGLSMAALAACAGDVAAPRWGSPTVVADGIDARSRPTLALTGDGHAVATLSGTANGLTRVLRAEPGSAAFRHVGEARMLAAPAPYGRDGVAYLLAPAAARSGLPIGDGATTSVGVSLATANGSLGRAHPLARLRAAPRDVQAALAGSPRGDLAIAWVQPLGGRSAVRLALLRPSGRGFTAPTTIAAAAHVSAIRARVRRPRRSRARVRTFRGERRQARHRSARHAR